MFDDARAQGYGLFVAAGYRTAEKQQQLMDEKTEAYENEGYSRSEAKRLAEQWVAIPGTSEHQIGIAVDINADKSVNSSNAVYTWLAENAYRYGFIRRYPEDKTDITGVINEPWHYRYVGKTAAQETILRVFVSKNTLKNGITKNKSCNKREYLKVLHKLETVSQKALEVCNR